MALITSENVYSNPADPASGMGTASESGPVDPQESETEAAKKIMQEAASKGRKSNAQASGTVPPNVLDSIVENIIKKKNLKSDLTTKVAIKSSMAVLAQEGATSPRFAETRTCSLFDVTISVKEIREECRNNSSTFRRLARALQPFAIQAAVIFDIEGNLSKKYKLTVPDATKTELYYASDFQTFNNDPNMPPRTRNWLMQNYNSRFGSGSSSET